MKTFRRQRKNETGTYLLQLTSMVDMFTIILVFLLKSYSTSAYQVVPADQISLPVSKSHQDPQEATKVALSSHSISVEDLVVINWQGTEGWKEHLHKKDRRFLPGLQKQLAKNKSLSDEIKKNNQRTPVKDHLVLQIDENTSYDLIKTVLASAALAGFTNYQMLTLKE